MRLMIHEASYRRCRDAIDAHAGRLELLLVDDAGVIRSGDAVLPPDAARPQAAWLNTDVFFSGGIGVFMGAVLGSPELRWVQSGAAGFDHAIFRQIVQKGARLTTSHGQAVGIADYVLWGVLDVLQDGPGRRAAQAGRRWERRQFREINGTRWTIFGFGAIGQAVAARARAFGAHITGVRRNPAPEPVADRIASPAQLLDLLPETDVLVLAAPASAETRHVANAAAFGRMKPGSTLVNVGRGALVDEAALLAALETGAPAHAVLDVFATEPQPADSPFWDHPRVTLTPHAADASNGVAARNDLIFLDNLGRILDSAPLANEIPSQDVLAG